MLVAARYLTVLPLPATAEPGDLGRAAGWFPVVGLLVGLLTGVALVGLATVVPLPVAAVLAAGVWVFLTGGLHLDGLADTLDGLGGGFSRDEALAIMRDARVGAYGVIGIVLVLGLKVAVLASLPLGLAWRAAVAAAVLGRVGPLVLVRLCPPARGEGAGQSFAGSVGSGALGWALLVAAAVTIGLLGPWGLLAVAAAALDAVAFAAYLRCRLGGLTGDCLGALVEGSEASVLTVVALLSQLGRL